VQTATAIILPQVHSTSPREAVQRVILPGVSWSTYEALLADMQDSHAAHFAYAQGMLEIMAPSHEHESIKHDIALLVEILAEEMEIDVHGGGSTTFRREDLAKGFEPDKCFYIRHVELVRGKKQIDLTNDPPPDLVIDITSPAPRKFSIFSALGIPEVWRYDGARVTIFTLSGSEYLERPESATLPKVTSAILTEFLDASRQTKRTAWLRQIRAWVRSV
jgi:Uma2 family endonuclease